MRKSVPLTAAVVLAAGLLPAAAQAHISLHPNAIPAGSYITTYIRVPNEETKANTTSIRVKLPDGVLSALGAPPAGWTFTAKTEKLPKPIKTDDGLVTTQTTEVDYTGGKILPGNFENFPLTLSIPDSAKAGDVLAFPTVQTYSNGDIVRWIGNPSDDKPSPTVDITTAGTALLDVTGGDAGPPAKLPANLAGASTSSAAATTPAPAAAAKTTIVKKQTSTLSIIALIVGALGLAAGGAALASRRTRT